MGIDFPATTTEEMARKFLESCRQRQLSDKTLEYYQWCLDKLVRQCPEWPSRPEQIAAAWDSPALGRVSRCDLERGLRIFLSWAEESHGCPNALRGTKKMPKAKTLPRVLEVEEAAAVWRACANAQERAMIALMLDTGIRLGELAGLRWADVGSRSLRVSGKTGPRFVPVSASVRKMLNGLGDSAHIWVSRRGPMSRSGVQMTIRNIFPRAGLEGPKLGPHLLRHTFATHYIDDGGHVAHLQRILGHASIETTMQYVNLAATALRSDHSEHSPGQRLMGD